MNNAPLLNIELYGWYLTKPHRLHWLALNFQLPLGMKALNLA